jgi:hypothetical protein
LPSSTIVLDLPEKVMDMVIAMPWVSITHIPEYWILHTTARTATYYRGSKKKSDFDKTRRLRPLLPSSRKSAAAGLPKRRKAEQRCYDLRSLSSLQFHHLKKNSNSKWWVPMVCSVVGVKASRRTEMIQSGVAAADVIGGDTGKGWNGAHGRRGANG